MALREVSVNIARVIEPEGFGGDSKSNKSSNSRQNMAIDTGQCLNKERMVFGIWNFGVIQRGKTKLLRGVNRAAFGGADGDCVKRERVWPEGMEEWRNVEEVEWNAVMESIS